MFYDTILKVKNICVFIYLFILVNIDAVVFLFFFCCCFFVSKSVILFAVFFTTWHDILSNSTFFRVLHVAYNARFTFSIYSPICL